MTSAAANILHTYKFEQQQQTTTISPAKISSLMCNKIINDTDNGNIHTHTKMIYFLMVDREKKTEPTTEQPLLILLFLRI